MNSYHNRNLLGTKPELHELQVLKFDEGRKLIRIMEGVTPKWKQVAIALGFNGSRIEAMEMGAHYQPGGACLIMFTDWLDGGHDLQPPTWEVLIQSLRAANLTEIANLLNRSIEIVSFKINVLATNYNHIQGIKDANVPMAVDIKTQVALTTATSDTITDNVQGIYSMSCIPLILSIVSLNFCVLQS